MDTERQPTSQETFSANQHDQNGSVHSHQNGHIASTMKIQNDARAWFQGPKSENKDIFNELLLKCYQSYSNYKEIHSFAEPPYISDDERKSASYNAASEKLSTCVAEMNKELAKSVPTFGFKYRAHMIWEPPISSTLAYFSAMLWNQNCVDPTGAPVTTKFEYEVVSQLCEFIGFSKTSDFSWAHLTSCGSIANFEACWAARNLLFHPLAIKAALNDPEGSSLKGGMSFRLMTGNNDTMKKIGECTNWELLNLSVDDKCTLSARIISHINETGNTIINDLFYKLIKKHSVITLGMVEFTRRHNINIPVICVPATFHYSFLKSASILGIGEKQIIPIKVDEKARQSISTLEESLMICEENKVPVMMVVGVLGSTRESAVDPISEIIQLRDKLHREKGFSFPIHVDGAWGGYMLSMLPGEDHSDNDYLLLPAEDCYSYIPAFRLSPFVEAQYRAVRWADTFTIDPHKSGFCHFPSSAIAYRNGHMRHFVSLKPEEITCANFSTKGFGLYGLEGSRPGGPAASILLSHRVIGLDVNGYGKILGQCQFGSLLYYCLWLVVAEEHDDFVCEPMLDLPSLSKDFPYSRKQAKGFIKECIIGKSNVEISKSPKVLNFLRSIGSDTLINAFVVNIKGNTDTTICNRLVNLIGQETGMDFTRSYKRFEIFFSTSTLESKNYAAVMKTFKKRLGLNVNDGKDLQFFRNVTMNPYQSCEGFVERNGKDFRKIVNNCVAFIKDNDALYTFVVLNASNIHDGKLYLEMIPDLLQSSQQYHVILTMKFCPNATSKFNRYLKSSSTGKLILQTKSKVNLMAFLRSSMQHHFQVFSGFQMEEVIGDIDLLVEEVLRYERFEKKIAYDSFEYKKIAEYFLFGDQRNVFMSRVVSKYPNVHQTVQVILKENSIPDQLVDLGILTTVSNLCDSPYQREKYSLECGKNLSYEIGFKGVDGNIFYTEVYVQQELLNLQLGFKNGFYKLNGYHE